MIYNDPTRKTIDERMQRIHTRMQLEKISGISAVTEPEQYLTFCQTWEQSAVAIHAPEQPDWDDSSWRNFDKWNDAPIFALPRRKAQVE